MIKQGSRKIILGLLVLSVGIAIDMLAPNGLTDNLLYLLSFVSVSFFLANGVEHVSDAIKKRRFSGQGIPAGEVDLVVRRLIDQTTQIDQKMDLIAQVMKTSQTALSLIMERAGVKKQ